MSRCNNLRAKCFISSSRFEEDHHHGDTKQNGARSRVPLELTAASRLYGASISSIFPSRVRCSTITFPLGSRNTNTSRSRKCASLIASSSVMGRRATEFWSCTRWTSVVFATDGNLCTITETVAPSAIPTTVSRFSCVDWPLNLLTALFFLLSHLVLYFRAC